MTNLPYPIQQIPTQKINSYEDFKKLVEAKVVYTSDTEIAQIKTRQYLRHTSISIVVCISAIAVQQIYCFLNLLDRSSKEEYRQQNDLTQNFVASGNIRSMIHKMRKLLDEWATNTDRICRSVVDVKDYSTKFADSIDYAEETISPIIAALRRYVTKYLSEYKEPRPDNNSLILELSMAIYLCDLSRHLFDSITSRKNFPILRDERDYNYLSLSKIWNQLFKIQSDLDIRDSDGKPTRFSIYNMLTTADVDAISDDIMYIVYSSEFSDKLYLIQTGIDLELRNSEYKSLIDSFESKTKSIRSTCNKYRKMYAEQNYKSSKKSKQ